VKPWRRKVTNVTVKQKGGPESKLKAIVVHYEPQESRNPQHKDPGAIETALIPNASAELVGKIAKESIGQWCTFFQTNVQKSEDNPHGFRQLVWIEPTDTRRQQPPQQQPAPQTVAPQPTHPQSAPTAPADMTPSQRARWEHEQAQQGNSTAGQHGAPVAPPPAQEPVTYTPPQPGYELLEDNWKANQGPLPGEEPF